MTNKIRVYLLISIVTIFCFFVSPTQVIAACSQTDLDNPKNICFYKTDYKTISNYLSLPNQIQIFSGDTVLSEFDESPDPTSGIRKYYAGHLGSFWTPPYYSSHELYSQSNPSDQLRSFYSAMVLYSRTYKTGIYESPSDLTTEAFWYPSKMEVSKFYPGGGGGTQVRGVKVALPGQNLALKETITNTSPNASELNVLFLVGMDTLGRLENWDRNTTSGWGWGSKKSYNSTTDQTVRVNYDSANKIVIFSNDQAGNPNYPAFAAIGIDSSSSNSMDWELSDNLSNLASNFKATGSLRNINSETINPGAVAGLAVRLPPLSQNQSYTATLLVAVGTSEIEVRQKLLALRGTSDVEVTSDNNWNTKLSLLQNLPIIETNNSTLKKIYYNSLLAYLLNRWDNFNSIGETSFYGLSNTFYPWTIGTNYPLTLFDKQFWREQIKKTLTMDFNHCLAYQPLHHNSRTDNLDRCETSYSYSPYSMVQIIYDYVAITGDRGFLNEIVDGKSVIIWTKELAMLNEQGNEGKLVNFGNDSNLYEFNHPSCSGLAGSYTGYVISPNTERYQAMLLVAQMSEVLGDTITANDFNKRATDIKAAIAGLWDVSSGWFKTINLYGADGKPLASPITKTFFSIAGFHPLDSPPVLTSEQISSLVGKIDLFIDPVTLRFSSLPIADKNSWCQRPDWHGPGLYSGEVGQMITRLFDYGRKEQAASIFFAQENKGYSFLSKIPLTFQAYSTATETFSGPSQGNAYLEGISLAQSVIRGMAGIEASITKGLVFHPHLPSVLPYPFSLKNISLQSFSIDFSASSPSAITLIFTPNTTTIDQLSFQYTPDTNQHTINLVVNKMSPSTNYAISKTNQAGVTAISVVTSDSSGTLGATITVNDASQIFIQKKTLSGDLNHDGKVDIQDYNQLVTDFGKTGSSGWIPADINNDGKVDIFDYNILVGNFGK